jgi:M6 family metalloprotease-like protein
MKKIGASFLLVLAGLHSSCTGLLNLGSSIAAPASSSVPVNGKRHTAIDEKAMDEASGTVCLNANGTQHILVIPVILTDYAQNATAANKARIETTFFGKNGEASWESVASFYAKSSLGKLDLQGKVTDWYDSGYSTTDLAKLTSTTTGYHPTWIVLRNAINWYKQTSNTDAKEFDNDGDGFLDGVWLVYSAPDYSHNKALSKDLFWAFTYWDYRQNASVFSPIANVYGWASYDFMDTGYGEKGTDAHTFCHETGHMLGLQDYYVTESLKNTTNYGPMANIDMMDGNISDHDAYSKFALGWIEPYAISEPTTITLKPAESSGEAILLPTAGGWNGSAFDEYLLLEYYTPTGVNLADASTVYPKRSLAFTENGVRIYHVDERLATVSAGKSGYVYAYTDSLVYNQTTYTMRAHSNSNVSNLLDPNDRSIQELDCTKKRNFDTECDPETDKPYNADNSTLFQDGDTFTYAQYQNSFPAYHYSQKSLMNDGSGFPYQIAFSGMSSSGITVSITAA